MFAFSRSNFISVLGLVTLGLAGIFFIAYATLTPKPHVKLTVFMHGTVGSSFNLLNPWQCNSEEFDTECMSARAVKRCREHELMRYDQIFGDEGFHEFVMDETPEWQAAQHLIPAYDAVAHVMGMQSQVHKYAIFGWSGFLHHGARRKAGYDLYMALCDYRDQLQSAYGANVEIDIVGHSHGGNVALWLDAAEKDLKRNLHVHALVMYGTPMQKEMAETIKSPVFETIVLMYSHGDGVQTRDYFSTKAGVSYSRMADITDLTALAKANPNLKRYDLCCVVNNDKNRITHTNMWLAGRSTPLFGWMDPLPLMVLTPVVLHTLQCHACAAHAQCHLVDHDDGCMVTLNNQPESEFLMYDAQQLRATLIDWAEYMRDMWLSPDDHSRHVLFNKKNWKLFKHVVWG